MLLIGSRAAKWHLPNFRSPHDWDFIGTTQEVKAFLRNISYIDCSTHEKKIRAIATINNRKFHFEFDLIEHCPSSQIIYQNEKKFSDKSKVLDLNFHVASLETLFLLKKSHITFPIHWQKNIIDYFALREKVQPMAVWQEQAFELRFDEVTKRVHKNMRFDVDNSEFFKRSEKFVQRVVEHDSLHYATCFYDEPLFLSAKEDLSKAELSPRLVWGMSEGNIIKMIQEETFVLALERIIIPAMIDRVAFDPEQAFIQTSAKMVNHYLPLFMRHFAVDHYQDILFHQTDYVKKCMDKHPTLRSIISCGAPQKSRQSGLARSRQHPAQSKDLNQSALGA